MTIRSFDLLQPRSLPEAVAMLREHGDDARALGGGTTLVILMKQRALHFPYLIDLQSIPGLAEIKREADGARIGALVTHRAVETSPLIRQAFPALSRAFGHIGNVRVRQTASVGGNLAHADYRRRRCSSSARRSPPLVPRVHEPFRSRSFFAACTKPLYSLPSY